MTQAVDPRQNRLLAALPEAELARWRSHLVRVDLQPGQPLYESGSGMRHVYFPVDSIVALMYVMADGASGQIALVGNEGLVGISQFMGGGSTPSRAVVQSAGQGYRLTAGALMREFRLGGRVMELLLRYTQALITQMAQTGVCNRHHSLDQQLCRWLLMSLDRLPASEILMTHEQIAHLLGVRRESITEAAVRLGKAGLIRYSRGRIAVLDRGGLERLACECYGVVEKEYARLLPEAT